MEEDSVLSMSIVTRLRCIMVIHRWTRYHHTTHPRVVIESNRRSNEMHRTQPVVVMGSAGDCCCATEVDISWSCSSSLDNCWSRTTSPCWSVPLPCDVSTSMLESFPDDIRLESVLVSPVSRVISTPRPSCSPKSSTPRTAGPRAWGISSEGCALSDALSLP